MTAKVACVARRVFGWARKVINVRADKQLGD